MDQPWKSGEHALRRPAKREDPAGDPSEPCAAPFDREPVRIPIADVFDLHSVADRDLRAVVEEYLREAHALGLRYIRLIHGRGIGVRRELVRSILERTEFVESFGDAPPEAGGWGATVAVLRPLRNPD